MTAETQRNTQDPDNMPETSTGQPCTRCKTENARYQIRGAPHCQSVNPFPHQRESQQVY